MFDGMSDDRVVALLLMRLNEQGNPGCRALFKVESGCQRSCRGNWLG